MDECVAGEEQEQPQGSLRIERMLPLYEAKMLHQYDHRWATYDGAVDSKGQPAARDVTLAEKSDPYFAALPRYWVASVHVREALRDSMSSGVQLGWRDIARSTDERTLISTWLPLSGVGNKIPLIRSGRRATWFLEAVLDSFVADFSARTKVASTSLNYFYLKQFPVPGPSAAGEHCRWNHGQSVAHWLQPRVLELTYTAWDMASFAEDLGDTGPGGMVNPPFIWDDERRSWLRAELDAAFFYLYGIERKDVVHIMDTFPIVRRKDEATHSEYRTRNRILAVYDALHSAAAVGEPYLSVLDPAPGHGHRHASRREYA